MCFTKTLMRWAPRIAMPFIANRGTLCASTSRTLARSRCCLEKNETRMSKVVNDKTGRVFDVASDSEATKIMMTMHSEGVRDVCVVPESYTWQRTSFGNVWR